MSNKKLSPASRAKSLGKRIGDLEEVIKLICGWVSQDNSLPPSEELQTGEAEAQVAASPQSSPVGTPVTAPPPPVASSSSNGGNAQSTPSTENTKLKNAYVKLIRCDYLMPKPTTNAAVNIPSVRLHSCAKCSLQFASFVDLACHRRKEHPSMSTYVPRKADNRHFFQCPKCDKVVSRHNIAHHIKLHTEPQLKHQCKRCPQRFTTKVQLAAHNRAEHLNINICVLCSAKFQSRDELIGHQMYHRLVKLESFPPIPTSATENEATPLNKHVCPICSEEFSTESKLKNHQSQRNAHLKVFKCSKCPLQFPSRMEVIVHRTVHKAEDPNKDKRTCDICLESVYRWSLKAHRQKHFKEKDDPLA